MKETAAENLRVAFFNFADRASGSEALICRTVEGLLARGVEARLYAQRRESGATYVHPFPLLRGEVRVESRFRTATGRNDTLFPSTLLLGRRAWIKDAHVWHFHNLHGHYVSIPLLAMQSRRRPVVLSPLDQFLSTGYCPYTLGCDRYLASCGNCPQLDLPYPGISRDATSALLAMKRAAMARSRFNLLVHTDYLARHLTETLAGAPPIEVLRYGVDTRVFRPMGREQAAAALGVTPPRRFVAGLIHSNVADERKGLLPLLGLLRDLADRMPGRIEVLVVGHSSEAARRYETPNLPVTTLQFQKDEASVAAALNLCDVLLYPTRAENLSLTCLSALACGVPVISTNVGGQREAIRDGVNGFLCEPGADGQFVERIVQLAADAELARDMSAAARRTAVGEFDINTYVDNLILYYGRVLRRGKRA